MDKIAVIDFGGQYAHLIANKIRRLHVLAEIRQPEDPTDLFAQYRGIIFSGSPAFSAHDQDSDWNKGVFDLEIPILGFCFGHQEIAKHYGGKVEQRGREFGPAEIEIYRESPIFKGLGPRETVWMSHNDTVTEIPEGFVELAKSHLPDGSAPYANTAIANEKLRRYGFQFHPEVDDTVHGDEMLSNFVFEICGCEASWSMERYMAEQMQLIKEQVAGRGVFLLASGGVDSTVCAKLIGDAIGPENMHLLHIDNGFMRKNESAWVLNEFRRIGLGENLHFVDASERFLKELEGVFEPERKRRIIGETFIRVFEEEAARLNLSNCLLGQGTIYPDTIESGGSKRADVIKTHHNRIPLIEEMIAAGRVIEPLKDLYKTEVRELGELLGIDPKMVWRHPFPGPGLGVRLLCSDSRLPEVMASHADEERTSAIAADFGLKAAILPLRSVGVKGDLRSYQQPVMLWGASSFENLETCAARIFRDVSSVNRCIWDITGRGVESAQLLEAYATRERFDLLRELDDIMMRALERHGLMRIVWQCPSVLAPLALNGRGSELAIVRPIYSERAMTARPARLPAELLAELQNETARLPHLSGLAVDVTTKPPGTIEWE